VQEHTEIAYRKHRGAVLFAALLLIIAVGIIGLVTRLLSGTQQNLESVASIPSAKLNSIQKAIAEYVSKYQRLPCPADGSLPAGSTLRGAELRDINPASLTFQYCTSPTGSLSNQKTGIVPWETLGIKEADVVNGKGDYLSYRVFSGPKGLTLDNGATMVHCDITNAPAADAAPVANGQCETINHNHSSAQFLSGKGLAVDESFAITDKIAYVVIDHGPNRAGAFLSSGAQNPTSSNADEQTNVLGTDGTTFTQTYKGIVKVITSNPTSATHFDDTVFYQSIIDLIKQAGLEARDWPDPPFPGFTATTTASLTTTGRDKFLTANPSDAQKEFQALSLGTEVGFGDSSGSGNYSACLWWPTPIAIYSSAPVSRKTLLVYVEASLNIGGSGGGFTVGFLPGNIASGVFTVTNNSCGEFSSRSRLGWQDGNLPSPRFAVEFDVNYDSSRSDPNNENHVAIDFNGVEHDGVKASSCSDSANTYDSTGGRNDCYTSPSTSWLKEGLTEFHKIRVEVEAMSPTCGNTAPFMKVWLIPASVCSVLPVSAECTNIQNTGTQYTPGALPAGSVVLSQCIPTPTPAIAFNNVYFGLTASAGSSATGFSVIFKNLKSGLVVLP